MQPQCTRTRHHATKATSVSAAEGTRHSLPHHNPLHNHQNGQYRPLKLLAEALVLLALACVCALSYARIWEIAAASRPQEAPGCSCPHASTVQALRGHALNGAHVTDEAGSLNCALLQGTSLSKPSLFIDSSAQGAGSPVWWAFFEHNDHADRRIGCIAVAKSKNQGTSWTPKGAAIIAPRQRFISTFVTFDHVNSMYVMLPTVHTPRGPSVDLYTAKGSRFPLRWQRLGSVLRSSKDVKGEGRAQFADAAAVHFRGLWWIFVTVLDPGPSKHCSLHLYQATNLTGLWTAHPSSPVSIDQRYAHNGGRPVVVDGAVHRWAKDSSTLAGSALHLLKLDLQLDSYQEQWVATRFAAELTQHAWGQVRHVDLQQVTPGGEWVGLLEGAIPPPELPPVLGGPTSLQGIDRGGQAQGKHPSADSSPNRPLASGISWGTQDSVGLEAQDVLAAGQPLGGAHIISGERLDGQQASGDAIGGAPAHLGSDEEQPADADMYAAAWPDSASQPYDDEQQRQQQQQQQQQQEQQHVDTVQEQQQQQADTVHAGQHTSLAAAKAEPGFWVLQEGSSKDDADAGHTIHEAGINHEGKQAPLRGSAHVLQEHSNSHSSLAGTAREWAVTSYGSRGGSARVLQEHSNSHSSHSGNARVLQEHSNSHSSHSVNARVLQEHSNSHSSHSGNARVPQEHSNSHSSHSGTAREGAVTSHGAAGSRGAEQWTFWLRSVLIVALLLVWLAQELLPALAPPRPSAQPQHHGPSAVPPLIASVLIRGWEKKDDGIAHSPTTARRPRMFQGLARLATTPSMQLGLLLLSAFCASTLLFLLFPSNFQCPRWAIKVDILPSPGGTHLDPAAPFFPVPAPFEQLVVVSGANAPFFDRLQNMVGSVQAWEPHQHMALYDLGFLKSQLVEMACWVNVEVRRFNFARYPPHVRDLGNYAFKALVLQEALLLHSAVIWIDAGLELRAPMHTLQSVLSQHGHVGALQEDAIGDAMYTHSKAMVDEMGMAHLWPQASRWQFCAGGLQGFVRGSDAIRLILEPVVNCSMKPACISPPGASRLNHNFDQTAFTLAIRANGNSYTCLPRETHCMWSTKKAARAPMHSSQPIEVISRGHRMPKPYTPLLKRRDHCKPLRQNLVPWARQAPTSFPVWNRYTLGFRLRKVYLQPVGDAIVQAGSCLDVHYVAHIFFWVACLLVWLGIGGCKSLCCKWRSASAKQLALHTVMAALVAGAVQTTLLDVLTRVH